jgi:hypothetical protein
VPRYAASLFCRVALIQHFSEIQHLKSKIKNPYDLTPNPSPARRGEKRGRKEGETSEIKLG